ncbi:MAG: SAM-dependent methyltransferase [Anaerolineaceae bacterium]
MNTYLSVPSLNIKELLRYQQKPEPFTPGETKFWTDPYIAKQLLKVHLDPAVDAASRPLNIINQSVDWLIRDLDLRINDRVLDLGCGPGLYASCLAQQGLAVTGVDFSQNSITYAIQKAGEDGLKIDYRCLDYLHLKEELIFDAVFLVFGDYCTFSPESRVKLLSNINQALKPGGFFVLDVSTKFLRERVGLKKDWHLDQNGFWRQGKVLVLEQGFEYENDLFLDQYIIIEEYGKITVYRNWFQDYTPESIRSEIQANGFFVESIWSDLTGTPFQEKSEWIGVVTRKPSK